MPGLWRKCRIAFRCARFTIWVLVLLLIGTFLWFNRIGLPDFVKTRLVTSLHERGVELEFSRMRLSLVHGLVAENILVGQAGTNNNPTFTARQVQLDLGFAELRHRRLQLDALIVRDGQFTLPLSPTNALSLTNLQTELRFGDNDTWSLNQLIADFAGTQIRIKGEIAHARESRNWKLLSGGGSTDRGALFASLKNFSDALRQIQFQGTSQLKLTVSGDARDIHSINARLETTADGVLTPWFSARNFQSAANLSAPVNAPTNNPPALGFWTNLQPFQLVWSVRVDDLRSAQLDGQTIDCAGVWSAPTLAVTNVSAKLGNGTLKASAALDVLTRKLTFTNFSDFDPHVLAKLLPAQTREQLAQVSWSTPPVLRADGSLRLPPWTNAANRPYYDIGESVQAQGELAFTNAVAGGVKLDRLHTHFRYDDPVIELPDLAVKQGRTELLLSGHESEATKNFRFRLGGQLDAATVQSFLTDSNALRGFGILTFHQPLALTLDVAGNLRTLETLTATGHIALADFAVRGQTVDHVAADLTYSNLMVDFFHPQLSRAGGTEKVSAEKVTLDIAGQRLFLIDAIGHADPNVVIRAIGPRTTQIMKPYEFLAIPTGRVNGCIPLKQVNDELVTDDADLRFDMTGSIPFRWYKFETPAITGTIHWWKDFIILTNTTATCYGGTAQGNAVFNVDPKIVGTGINFFVVGTNVDLHRMGQALWSPTNRLEGSIAGTVTVTHANSSDWRTWNGDGQLQLRDGLLWDVPVIAIMSPLLNAVTPGLGNSRATEATARFTMTNGIIHTDSMLIRSTMMRLQYSGSVDLLQNVQARVSAQLLRNTPVLGTLMSAVLWPVSKIFECEVTGKLSDPIVKPVYMPAKLLLVPLHPIKTLEELFSSPATTNAPVTK